MHFIVYSLVLFTFRLRPIAALITSPLGPVVDLGYAAFAGNSTSPSGIINSNVTFYGGIPYAEPPIGDLRWRAPKMLNENAMANTVADARNWGPPCIQGSPTAVGIGSEDCLTLNVWKPTNASEGDKLPVAVYIHGGGFYAGSPQGFPLYDWVAQHPTGIVGASITYRLGILGFFGGPTVNGIEDFDLNVGLLDQRAGLEWIQRHVAKFGGDPEDVTIIGESAGGASMIMQITAYGGTKPIPFKRVVAESIGFGPTQTDAQIEGYTTTAVDFIGCPTSGTAMFACLRNASIGAIVGAINSIPNDKFSPVVEGPGGFMPDLPSRLIHSGNFSTVESLIAGHCTGDGKTFAGGSPDQFMTDEDIKDIVFTRWPGVSNETQNQGLAMYPAANTTDPQITSEWDRAWMMAGQIIFTCMDWFIAEAMLNRSINDVFSYAWNVPDTVLYDAKPYLGSMHTSDLYFLFDALSGTNTFPNAGNSFTSFNASELAVSKEAIAYWTSFAQSGDPSVSKLSTSPIWESFANSSDISNVRQRLLISRGNDTATASQMQFVSSAERERCQFWMSEAVTNQTRV